MSGWTISRTLWTRWKSGLSDDLDDLFKDDDLYKDDPDDDLNDDLFKDDLDDDFFADDFGSEDDF